MQPRALGFAVKLNAAGLLTAEDSPSCPNFCLGTRLSPQLRCPQPAPAKPRSASFHAEIPVRKARSANRDWATELPGQWHSQTEFGNEMNFKQAKKETIGQQPELL